MPLSASDVVYINRLLDRHLKNQRSWPWMRYFVLAISAFMIGMGIWSFSLAGSFARTWEFTLSAATRPAHPASSRPVTREEMEAEQALTEIAAKTYAWGPSFVLECYIGGGFFIWLGISCASSSLSKWNHHRRDAILIALLREKCAAELAMPESGATDSK